MNTDRIRNLLGQLQANPDSAKAWEALAQIAIPSEPSEREELARLLRAAAQPHAERGEWEAVEQLTNLALSLSVDPRIQSELLAELGRIRRVELIEEDSGISAYRSALELSPGLAAAEHALSDHADRATRWRELVANYAQEAEAASDDVYRSSMLMRAAEMELRFGGESLDVERIVERLEQAVRLDATNAQAGRMLERRYRKAGRWEDAARVLERMASRARDSADRVAACVRLARLYRYQLDDSEQATQAYERLLREAGGHPEALEFLAQLYSLEERWDELVAVYERALKAKDQTGPESLGDMLQIAMLHAQMRAKPKDAEPWFERIRKIAPAHERVLAFFREYCQELGDEARWIEVLQAAQHAMPDGKEKAKIAAELAELAEGQANAQKAIEQYKGVLRQDPDNESAREALKRLYKATQGFNALVELLRVQLERTPADQYQKRLTILREVAAVYRQYVRSDTSLVTVLHQIVQLDEKLDEEDVEELRELVVLYDKLARHRELLTYQVKLAEVTPDLEEKKRLYRSVARRWLEQFSNFQNATEAYEALLQVAEDDDEALERLNELYRKRRAWAPLYDLLARGATRHSGAQRLAILAEMAQLASERLHRSEDAIRLYREILDEDPSRSDILDALEKHAERNKDWATLAQALERRLLILTDDSARLAVLQKLGAVYADHLADSDASAHTWRRVLEIAPGHPRALRVLRDTYLQRADYDGLADLYGSQKDWDGLVEVLSNAADRATSDAVKIELSYRAAAVLEGNLHQPERAFRSYERVLSVDPTDVRAARALVPIYEAEEKWSRLPAIYEVLLPAAETTADKLGILFKLVEVTGGRLSDRRGAAAYARRAWEIAPTDSDAYRVFEEATRSANAWEPWVEAITARLSSMTEPESSPRAAPAEVEENRPRRKTKKRGKRTEVEPEVAALSRDEQEQRRLELALARVQCNELAKLDDAVATYRRLVTRSPADSEATAEFEQLLRANDRRDDLRWLYEHRVTVADGEHERIARLTNWAQAEQSYFGAPDRAIELYRQVTELDSENREALKELARLLLEADRVAESVACIERRRDLSDGPERVELEIALSELYLNRLQKPEAALDAAVRALESAGTDPRALSVVEALLDEESTRLRAAEVLALKYASAGEARREAQALVVLLAAATERSAKLDLVARLMDLYSERLSERGSALDVALRAGLEFPDEAQLWDRAEELASEAGRPTDLADTLRTVMQRELPTELTLTLCERAARLHEERLGDPMGAIPYWEKILDIEPDNEHAFGRLKAILTAAERWGELESMYDRTIEHTADTSRRVDMLVEVALIAEEIIGDTKKAIRHYERILELDGLHAASLEALDRLYTRHDRFEPLAGLLARRLQVVTGQDAIELKRRLAIILLDKLHRPEDALGHVEDVLQGNCNDYEARSLAERILTIGTLRAKIARTLEKVYEARDEIRDLVRVLSIRLETQTADQQDESSVDRRELLRRIAVLRDERLHDDEGAFQVYKQYVPLEPPDIEARARLVDIGRRLGRLAEVAEAIDAARRMAVGTALRAEIGMQVAGLQQSALGDMVAAEGSYRAVVELDPNDVSIALPAAKALEAIYVQKGENKELADILRLQVRLASLADERQTLLRRLGALCRDTLDDKEAATAAFRECLEEDSADTTALEALDALYEQTEAYSALANILERRRELADNAGERRIFAVRRAKLLAAHLDDTLGSVNAWRDVVSEFGPDAESMSALESLFEDRGAWQDLADTLEQHLDIVDEDATRLELLVRLGKTRRERLADSVDALEAFRRALSLDSRHPATREALQEMLQGDDLFVRREAAVILHPVFELEGDPEQLLRVLRIEIDTEEDPSERLVLLATAVRVAEEDLRDPVRAFEYAERASREALGHSDLGQWLGHLDRLAEKAKMRSRQIEILRDVVDDIFDGEVKLEVTLKIASMARDELSDVSVALQYFERALEQRPDERVALAALESLHEQRGDFRRLLDVVARRVEVAADDQERKQLLFRQATLLADRLEEPARAIEVYERILDLEFDTAAVMALDQLYRTQERWDALILLLQRQLDRTNADRPRLLVAIAEVYASYIGDLARSLDEIEQALEIERFYAPAVELVERLLSTTNDPEQKARAAALVEPVYLARGDLPNVMVTLRARLESSAAPEERRELLGRLAKIQEEQAEDYAAALETVAQLFHEDPSDDAARTKLERLAKVAGAERRLAEIYAGELENIETDDLSSAQLAARAAEIFEAHGERDRALSLYQRAFAFDPERAQLFESVDRLLAELGRHSDRIDLYRKSLDYRTDSGARSKALHVIAGLQRDMLNDRQGAIETLREALDVDESEAAAFDELGALYRDEQRWDDMADLLLRRAEQAESGDEAAGHRVTLARLLLDELDQPERAIDQLEEVVRARPEHRAAIDLLEALRLRREMKPRVVEILRPLYEATDDWQNLVRLNEDRFELAIYPADKVAILQETAQLYESRGGDYESARQALAFALEADPENVDVRGDFERLTAMAGQWAELASTYEKLLADNSQLVGKREVLGLLARTYDEYLDDPRRALSSLWTLHEMDPADLETLQQMERLATLLSDWEALVKVLVAKAELLLGDEERASCWRHVGEAYRDMLENPAGAIEAYERALELEPANAFTVDCLLELVQAAGASERVAELLLRREELCEPDETDLKYDLLLRAADVLQTNLSDRPRAIEVLVQVLTVRPVDPEVLRRLEVLYEAESMWPELLDNLRVQAAAAVEVERRVRLKNRIAGILSRELSSFDEALGAYAEVLAELPTDPDAISAVLTLGREREDLRSQVAGVLVPVLEGTHAWAQLVEVLEMRLTTEHEPGERAATLLAVAAVAEPRLGDPQMALSALLRAMSEQPEDPQLHAEIERVAGLVNGYARVADVLSERARATFDPEISRDLYVRLAYIVEEKLGDQNRAVEAYRQAIEQVGDRRELLGALDRLFVALDDAAALADVLERRTVTEDDDNMVADLYYRLGFVQMKRFSQPDAALASLRSALDRVPAHAGAIALLEELTERPELFDDVAETLESVYRDSNQPRQLAELFRKRVASAGTREERLDLQRSLAQVLEEQCGDLDSARLILQQTLMDDPSDLALVDELERLSEKAGAWAEASAALVGALEGKSLLGPEIARELWLRAAAWQRDRVGDPKAAERSLLQALEVDPDNDDILQQLEALRRVPGRERDLVEVIRHRGKLALGDAARSQLFEEARQLAGTLGDAQLVESVVRELLGLDDRNLWALEELTALRRESGDYEETFVLLSRQIELVSDGPTLEVLRHEAATVARDRLGKPDQAIELLSVLFDNNPFDREASTALRSLLSQAGRYQELARVLERLIEVVDNRRERSSLLVELARLHESKFDDVEEAARLLQSVLDEEPNHAEAVIALSTLYERTGANQDLADLLLRQIESARDRGDTEAEVSLMVRFAEVNEGPLANIARAIETYRAVLERISAHRPALEALVRLYESSSEDRELAQVLHRLSEMTEGAERAGFSARRAEALLRLDDREGAAQAFARALEAEPDNGDLRSRLRALYEDLGAWEQLASLLSSESDAASEPVDKVRLLREAAALHLDKRGDPAAAAELLEKASAIAPNDRDLLLHLCDAHSASGRGDKAAATLERIVESYGGRRSKELGEIHRRLGEAYLAQRDPERARDELEKAFRIEPGNIRVIARLAEVCLSAGDAKRAQQLYSSLIIQLPKLDPTGPITKAEIYGRRGEASLRLGDKDKAKHDFERALQADPNLTWVKERLAELAR